MSPSIIVNVEPEMRDIVMNINKSQYFVVPPFDLAEQHLSLNNLTCSTCMKLSKAI